MKRTLFTALMDRTSHNFDVACTCKKHEHGCQRAVGVGPYIVFYYSTGSDRGHKAKDNVQQNKTCTLKPTYIHVTNAIIQQDTHG